MDIAMNVLESTTRVSVLSYAFEATRRHHWHKPFLENGQGSG